MDSVGGKPRGLTAVLGLAVASPGLAGAIPIVLPSFLIDEFDLSRGQIGLLLTTFALTGAVSSPILGRVADAIGGRRLLAAHFAIALLAILGIAASNGYPWLLASLAVAGISAATANPTTNKLIAARVSPGRIGTVIGVKQSSGMLGVFAAGAFLPTMSLAIGWRPAVALAALLPLSGWIATTLVLRRVDPPPRPPVDVGARALQEVAIRWLMADGFLMGAGTAALLGFLPLYAQESAGMGATAAGLLAGTAGAVAIVGRIVWGRHTGRVRNLTTPLGVIGLLSAGTALAIWAQVAAGSWLLWVGAVAAGASLMAWNAVGMVAVVAIAGAEGTGRASGMVISAFLAGMIPTPFLFGYIVDQTGTFAWGWAAVALIFLAAALTTLVWRRTTDAAAAAV